MGKEIFVFPFSSLKACCIQPLTFLYSLGPPVYKAFLWVFNFLTTPEVVVVCTSIAIIVAFLCYRGITAYILQYCKRKGDLRAKRENLEQIFIDMKATYKERQVIYRKMVESILSEK